MMAVLKVRRMPILSWALVLGAFLSLPTALSEGAVHWSIGQVEDPPADAPVCPALSKAHLAKFAKNNTVLITVVDQLIMRKFGKSWVENVKAAGVDYWLVAALDPWTSRLLGHWGVKQCFNAPMERLRYKGSDSKYQWGSGHWTETTWSKVYVVAAVHELGFHIVFSDADVTWFKDPMPYISSYFDGPVHGIFATDALGTENLKANDQGLEAMTNPNININTGMYFLRYWEGGKKFFEAWFSQKSIGHDQDGFNSMSRGREWRGDQALPSSHLSMRHGERMFACAMDNTTLISFLPVSMFGNAYTFVVGQVHKQLSHALYAVHWVWSGSTMESKQQTIRDAMKFWDPPEYYTTPSLVTFDMWVPEPFSGFNAVPFDDTEKMIQFHIYAANTQLRQTYYGFVAALGLGRVLVMPKFQCFCAKNWYMTQSCRINGEKHSTFPYDCALSHVMRVKRLLHGGMEVPGHQPMTIREHTFLANPNVPEEIKKSRLVLVPSDLPRPDGDVSVPSRSALKETTLPDGSVQLQVPWPLDVEELKELLGPMLRKYRIIHFVNATKILGRGFHDPGLHKEFDSKINKLTTHWCCRSPKDQERYNATDLAILRILPVERDPSANVFKAVFGIERYMAGYNNSY